MRLSDGSYINNVARLERAEEIEEASEAIDKEIASMPKEPEKDVPKADISDEDSI